MTLTPESCIRHRLIHPTHEFPGKVGLLLQPMPSPADAGVRHFIMIRLLPPAAGVHHTSHIPGAKTQRAGVIGQYRRESLLRMCTGAAQGKGREGKPCQTRSLYFRVESVPLNKLGDLNTPLPPSGPEVNGSLPLRHSAAGSERLQITPSAEPALL